MLLRRQANDSDFGFDNGGRLTSEVHKDGAGASLVTYGNAYDGTNRITTETRNGTPKNYTYDVNSQVTSDGTTNYSNDANGNRTMAGYVTGTANRTTSDGTWTYTHNAEGNIIKRSKGASQETWTYGYDHNNRLLWVEKRDTDGGQLRTRVDYKYDALNNRIFDKSDEYSAGGILLSSVTSKHLFDGQNVYADLNSAGAFTTRYLLGDALGQRYGRSESANSFFLLTDRLGSVREVLTLAGAISSVIAYDAFGNILSESNPATSGNYLFTGLLYWRATGMYSTPNREYLAALGKWLQVDFIGFAGGLMNLYGYVGNNGTNRVDLSGLADQIIPVLFRDGSVQNVRVPQGSPWYTPFLRLREFQLELGNDAAVKELEGMIVAGIVARKLHQLPDGELKKQHPALIPFLPQPMPRMTAAEEKAAREREAERLLNQGKDEGTIFNAPISGDGCLGQDLFVKGPYTTVDLKITNVKVTGGNAIQQKAIASALKADSLKELLSNLEGAKLAARIIGQPPPNMERINSLIRGKNDLVMSHVPIGCVADTARTVGTNLSSAKEHTITFSELTFEEGGYTVTVSGVIKIHSSSVRWTPVKKQ